MQYDIFHIAAKLGYVCVCVCVCVCLLHHHVIKDAKLSSTPKHFPWALHVTVRVCVCVRYPVDATSSASAAQK